MVRFASVVPASQRPRASAIEHAGEHLLSTRAPKNILLRYGYFENVLILHGDWEK